MSEFHKLLAEEFGGELESFLHHPPVPRYVRANTLRTTPDALLEIFRRYDIRATLHSGVPNALLIDEASEERLKRCWHHFLGYYVIQSLGSMVPPIVLDPQPTNKVLDLCAAPGSKTTQIAAMMRGQGRLWANDVKMSRTRALTHRIDETGALNAIVLCEPGESFGKEDSLAFDAVLADVPCTGLGVRDNLSQCEKFFRKRGRLRSTRTQEAILRNAVQLVKEGGRIVYSTCSLMTTENEEVIDRALRDLPLRLLDIPQIPGLLMREGHRMNSVGVTFDASLTKTRRIVPWENPTQGFFVALLERTGPCPKRDENVTKPQVRIPTRTIEDPEIARFVERIAKNYGIEPAAFERFRYIYREKKRTLYLVSPDHLWTWSSTIRPGIVLARSDLGDWRLSHASARLLGDLISRNIQHLSYNEISLLANGGRVDTPKPDTPHPVLATEQDGPFAMGVWEQKLRWKTNRRYTFPAQM